MRLCFFRDERSHLWDAWGGPRSFWGGGPNALLLNNKMRVMQHAKFARQHDLI